MMFTYRILSAIQLRPEQVNSNVDSWCFIYLEKDEKKKKWKSQLKSNE